MDVCYVIVTSQRKLFLTLGDKVRYCCVAFCLSPYYLYSCEVYCTGLRKDIRSAVRDEDWSIPRVREESNTLFLLRININRRRFLLFFFFFLCFFFLFFFVFFFFCVLRASRRVPDHQLLRYVITARTPSQDVGCYRC